MHRMNETSAATLAMRIIPDLDSVGNLFVSEAGGHTIVCASTVADAIISGRQTFSQCDPKTLPSELVVISSENETIAGGLPLLYQQLARLRREAEEREHDASEASETIRKLQVQVKVLEEQNRQSAALLREAFDAMEYIKEENRLAEAEGSEDVVKPLTQEGIQELRAMRKIFRINDARMHGLEATASRASALNIAHEVERADWAQEKANLMRIISELKVETAKAVLHGHNGAMQGGNIPQQGESGVVRTEKCQLSLDTQIPTGHPDGRSMGASTASGTPTSATTPVFMNGESAFKPRVMHVEPRGVWGAALRVHHVQSPCSTSPESSRRGSQWSASSSVTDEGRGVAGVVSGDAAEIFSAYPIKRSNTEDGVMSDYPDNRVDRHQVPNQLANSPSTASAASLATGAFSRPSLSDLVKSSTKTPIFSSAPRGSMDLLSGLVQAANSSRSSVSSNIQAELVNIRARHAHQVEHHQSGARSSSMHEGGEDDLKKMISIQGMHPSCSDEGSADSPPNGCRALGGPVAAPVANIPHPVPTSRPGTSDVKASSSSKAQHASSSCRASTTAMPKKSSQNKDQELGIKEEREGKVLVLF